MALELFKPFVMKDLVEKGVANNIKSAPVSYTHLGLCCDRLHPLPGER